MKKGNSATNKIRKKLHCKQEIKVQFNCLGENTEKTININIQKINR